MYLFDLIENNTKLVIFITELGDHKPLLVSPLNIFTQDCDILRIIKNSEVYSNLTNFSFSEGKLIFLFQISPIEQLNFQIDLNNLENNQHKSIFNSFEYTKSELNQELDEIHQNIEQINETFDVIFEKLGCSKK